MADATVADVLSGAAQWAVVHGDLFDVLPTLPDVDLAVFDPPYSRRVHENARTSRRTELPDVADFDCRTKRRIEIGFEHLDPKTRRFVAAWCGKNVKRWAMAFCDVESAWLWRLSLTAAGMNYRVTGEWDRLGGAPQFNGMEPAHASEAIVIAHRPGKRHWNGGGKPARWSVPIVANRLGQRNSRVHETQKPDSLLTAMLADFADPGDLVVDMFCGAGSTGIGALRKGCRFIGIEKNATHVETARRRLTDEPMSHSFDPKRAKQEPMFR